MNSSKTAKFSLCALLLALGCDHDDDGGDTTEVGSSTSENSTGEVENSTGGDESTTDITSSSTGEELEPAGACGFCPKGLVCVEVADQAGWMCSRYCNGQIGSCDDLGMVCKQNLTEDNFYWCVDTCTWHEQCPEGQWCTGAGSKLGVCVIQ